MEQTTFSRFLVADDDSLMRGLISAVLQSSWPDTEIVAAANGFDVIKAMEDAEGAFDLLILDIHMPEMGGLETLTRIANDYPGTRTLAVSGGLGSSFDRKPILEMASFLGASAVLQKPFTEAELIAAVRDLLEGKAQL